MIDATSASDQNHKKASELQFGDEIEVTDAGFSFQPIQGFELELDSTVYMYSESGNLEIYLAGGELEEEQSIVELNDDLAAEFLENAGEFDLFQAGTDQVQSITGFVNEIRFNNVEEDGLGRCLICSPYINQFFFMLVIANAEYWQAEGASLWKILKSNMHFQPRYLPEIIEQIRKNYPDLTTEIIEDIAPVEEFFLTVEKEDMSLLLAARSYAAEDNVSILEITAPGGESLYHYDPQTGDFSSSFCDQPIIGTYGEVCFFHPRANQQALQPGDYRFNFATASGEGLQEIHFIIRSGRALGLQKIDLNFWLAMKDSPLLDQPALEKFVEQIRQTLTERLAPLNLAIGQIDCIQPAPDELESFSTINLDSDLADCSYMIAESVSNDRALNIGLVDAIWKGDPPQPANVKAVSSGSPGMILSPGSPHTCIVMSWPTFKEDPKSLANAIIDQLVTFSGIATEGTGQQPENGDSLTLNREIAWRLRRHPLFYDAG